MKNILLTGATGFIGKVVAENMANVVCVVRKGGKHSFTNYIEIESISGLLDWSFAFDNVEAIVHLAGLAHRNDYEASDYEEVNFLSTIRLAEQAVKAGVRRFVFISSIGVNGISTSQSSFSVRSTPHPHNEYSKSKYDAELGLMRIAKETGLEVVIIRPTLVYGVKAPGNFGALVRLIQRLPLLPFGLIENKRDFISVQNLADLIITCTEHPNAAGHTFLASESETVSIKEFTSAIAKGLGTRLYQLPIPINLMRLGGQLSGKLAMVEQLVGNLEVDSSNLKEVLGWTPPYTMEESMSFLKKQK